MSSTERFFVATEDEISNEWFASTFDAVDWARENGFPDGEYSVLSVEHDFDTILLWLNDGIYPDVAYRAFLTDFVGWHHAFDSWDELTEKFVDAYAGEWNSPEDWATEYIDGTGLLSEVPESLRYYIDYETFARDAEMSGDINFVEIAGSTFAFYGNW